MNFVPLVVCFWPSVSPEPMTGMWDANLILTELTFSKRSEDCQAEVSWGFMNQIDEWV